jgi:hypothetical protein
MNSDTTTPQPADGAPETAAKAAAEPAKKAPKKTATKTTKTTAKRDQPYFDPVAYGNGPDDSVAATEADENAAVTHHTMTIGGSKLAYTATVGHLVTVDPSSSKPDAKMFYVAFTKDNQKEEERAVTFFYNGGPGSSSVFVLLGSFAPRRIKTAMPSFTPPAPYQMEDNADSLIDKSDLVFINPVGTGYSAAIAPNKNRDFWGVDQDANSIKQFIKRYLTKNNRWNSPKFLFGESYGTARSCVLAYLLHEDGVDLNGVTLQSSILDYRQAGNPVGALPTAAADAWYHKKLGVHPTPTNLEDFAEEVAEFARTDYLNALRKFPQTDDDVVQKLSEYTGIDKVTLLAWSLDIAAYDSRGNSLFLTTLLKSKGQSLGSYDGRAKGHRCARQHHPVHRGRPGSGHGAERRPEGVVGERDVRLRHAVLPDRDRSAADAADRQDGEAESLGDVLSIGTHGLSRRRIAHAVEKGPREDVRGGDDQPCRDEPHYCAAADDGVEEGGIGQMAEWRQSRFRAKLAYAIA